MMQTGHPSICHIPGIRMLTLKRITIGEQAGIAGKYQYRKVGKKNRYF